MCGRGGAGGRGEGGLGGLGLRRGSRQKEKDFSNQKDG